MEEFAAFETECCQNLLEETSSRRGEKVKNVPPVFTNLLGKEGKGKERQGCGDSP